MIRKSDLLDLIKSLDGDIMFLDERIDALEKEVERIAKGTIGPKRKPGRPKKQK